MGGTLNIRVKEYDNTKKNILYIGDGLLIKKGSVNTNDEEFDVIKYISIIERQKRQIKKLEKKYMNQQRQLDELNTMLDYFPGIGNKYLEAKSDFEEQSKK